MSESSKHTIQIIQLLEERSMSFSFCLNKTDLLILCGMTLLYQSLELKQDSMMLKDIEKLVNVVLKIVGRMKAPSTYDFKRIASLAIRIDEPPNSLPTPPGQSPETNMAAPPQKSPTSKPKKKPSLSASQPQHYSIGRHSSVSETDLRMQQEKLKRMSMPNNVRSDLQRQPSRASLDSGRPNLPPMTKQPRQRHSMSQAGMIARVSPPLAQRPGLDYIPMGHGTAGQISPTLPAQNTNSHHDAAVSPGDSTQPFYSPVHIPHKSSTGGMSAAEWDSLLGQIDGGQANLYDAIYGGPQVTLDTPVASVVESNWSPDALDLSTFNLGDFGGSSLSEESLSSVSGGDDLSSLDFRDFSVGNGAMMTGDGFILDGISRDVNYGL